MLVPSYDKRLGLFLVFHSSTLVLHDFEGYTSYYLVCLARYLQHNTYTYHEPWTFSVSNFKDCYMNVIVSMVFLRFGSLNQFPAWYRSVRLCMLPLWGLNLAWKCHKCTYMQYLQTYWTHRMHVYTYDVYIYIYTWCIAKYIYICRYYVDSDSFYIWLWYTQLHIIEHWPIGCLISAFPNGRSCS